MDRRDFVKGITGGLIAGSIISSNAKNTDITEPVVNFKYNSIIPNGLKKGSKIAITAPSSPTNPWEIQNCLRFCKNNGLTAIIGDTIKNQSNNYKYFSAPDDVRLKELNGFIERDDIDAIICGRGGYGIMRILPKINYNALISYPKIIMGFSDITALLLAVNKMTKLVTYHGPVASSLFDQTQSSNLLKTIFSKDDGSKLKISQPTAQTIYPGIASGKLTGGNLTILTSTLGTEFEIDTTDSIFFFEDVSVHSYQIDRMLTQLLLANKLQKCKGIIIGEFKNLTLRKPFYPNKGYSLMEVFDQVLKPLNIPTVLGFNFGHLNTYLTLPIGINATLDAKKLTLTTLEQTVL